MSRGPAESAADLEPPVREPIVSARDLRRTFGEGPARVDALRGVTLALARGEFVAVMGPSGSGKSTLLHVLGGLAPPTGGSVHIAGCDLAALDDDALTLLRRRSIGFIFQAFNLLPSLTALENVALPLAIDGVVARDADERARAALERVGLAERIAHYPGQLSGGEQQRAAIARAMIAAPLILLADEPTGNLDSASSEHLMDLLRGLVDSQRQTVLMVTHDPRCAEAADRIVRLQDGCIAGEERPASRRSTRAAPS